MDNEKVAIECPDCKAPMTVTLGDVAAQKLVHCPNKHDFQLSDEGGVVRKVQKAYDDMHAKIKNLGKG